MNVPMSWIKEYVELDCELKEFTDKMTMSGSKVESVKYIAEDIKNVLVGKILSIAKHPNADKLVICQVDMGTENIQIITGATNVYEGAYVPVALHGAVLAEGLVIKKGNIRGEKSNGMMCSLKELGLEELGLEESCEAAEQGIYIFESEPEIGSDALDALEIREAIVEFEITSNRPDCFSITGIAREAAATFNKPLKLPEIKINEKDGSNTEDLIKVEIQNSELCPRYIARLIKNVKIEPSPHWMRKRLSDAGMRPINNIVDITNYVMLEFGQPMHAFDIDNIDERKIIVRNAYDNEEFVTLDNLKRKLDSNMLVISDCNKAIGIAGVMGGENSKITENATAILFESANFNGTNIRLTAKKLGLRTDASAKYEKGLDPNLAEIAVERAMQLVEELGCGEVIKGKVDCYPNKRESWTVTYSPDRINNLIGTNLTSTEIQEYLGRLGIKAENNTAYIPTFRPDIKLEADLAEEVARMYGYDVIEPKLLTGTPTVGKKTQLQILDDITKDTMVSFGFCEAMTYSFESPKVFDKLAIEADSELRNTVKILNPLGEAFSIMRTTTINGMLQSLSTNFNKRNEDVKLFEVSRVYLPNSLPLSELPDEPLMLTLGMYGKTDFYDLKGYLQQLFDIMGIQPEYITQKGIPFMHPGRTADISVCGKNLGFFGELHPLIAERYEIDTKAYIAVVKLSKMFDMSSIKRVYKPLPKFPEVQRDIAVIVKEDTPVIEVEKAIREKAKFLAKIQLFDVYTGKQVEDGYKSVAYNLSFRSPDRTLNEKEVNTVMKNILSNLENKIDAKLRS